MDLANSFGSVSHETLDETQTNLIRAEDYPYFAQTRYRWFIELKLDDESSIHGQAKVGLPMEDRTQGIPQTVPRGADRMADATAD